MNAAIPGRPPEPHSAELVPSDMRDETAIIGAQQSESLALLRQLTEMLLPRRPGSAEAGR